MRSPIEETTTLSTKTLWEEEEKAFLHNLKKTKGNNLKKMELLLHLLEIFQVKKLILTFTLQMNWLIYHHR